MYRTFIVIFPMLALLAAGCGTVLPDRVVYPNDMKKVEPKSKQKDTITVGDESQKKAQPEITTDGTQIPVEQEMASAEDAETLFGDPEAPDEAAAETPEEVSKPQPPAEEPVQAPVSKSKKKITVDAKAGNKGHNSLTRKFNMPFEEGWESIIETILDYPLINVDKSSGIIITDWVMDKNIDELTGLSLGIFGENTRIVRYKWVVRVYDRGDATEVIVIPFAQSLKNRRWSDGKPAIIITEKLMKKLIARMEK